jgi:hypothetical protein
MSQTWPISLIFLLCYAYCAPVMVAFLLFMETHKMWSYLKACVITSPVTGIDFSNISNNDD